MTGYTKFKSSHTNESSSDSFYYHQTNDKKNQDEPSSGMESGDSSMDDNIQIGAPKLQRNSSVSSSNPSVQMSAVKRAFSMRRSSSVSERYCRIYDQRLVLTSSMDCDEAEEEMENYCNGSVKVKKSGSGGKRIWKACKRVFGF